MYHYTYLLTFGNGMRYIGCRSTNLLPEHDELYLGSGKALPERHINNCHKQILNTYPTRKEARDAEIAYIVNHDCVNSQDYYNMRIATFDRHGTESVSTNLGRTKETHSYIREAGLKRRKYVGEARTKAQKASDARRTGQIFGPCKEKGSPGMINSGFNPWYLITPDGNYQEIQMTKLDFAATLGVSARQLGHRFHYSNMHKPATRDPWKGWVFGNLPETTEPDTGLRPVLNIDATDLKCFNEL